MNKKKIFYSITAIIVLIFLILNSKDFRIDASSDTLVAQHDEDFQFYKNYNQIFPSRNFLVIAVKSNTKINDAYIKNIEIISKKLSSLKQVENIFNINKAPILFSNNTDLLDLSNAKIETITNSNYNLNIVLNEFAESPIYKDQIINTKKNISSIIIYLKQNKKLIAEKNKYKNFINKESKQNYLKIKSQINIERKLLINDIRKILKNSDQNYEYYLGGIDMIADDVITFVKKDIIIFSIAVLLFVILILFIIFREIKWVVICLTTSCYAVASMFGLLAFLNIEVTAISSNFASLMFILSISMNIHIINNYKKNFETKNNYIFLTVKRMFWPCIYTVLTTIVAFCSLLISDIKPIIDFGLIMILSLLVILISSFTILPLLISFSPISKNYKSLKFSILTKLYELSIRNFGKISFLNLIILVLSIYGITQLKVENSFINYFKKNTEIFQGMKIIDRELGGTTPLDIIITFNKDEKESISENKDDDLLIDDDLDFDDLFDSEDGNNIWFTEEKLNTIREIHEYLENRVEIGKVQSIHTLLSVGNKINKTPLSIFELSVLYKKIPENYKEDLIYPYLIIEKDMAKLTARVKDSNDINRNQLINEIDNYLNKNYKNIKEIKVNGLLVLYNNMLQSLFSSQIKSLGFVIIAIFIMFIILFKSLKLSILGIIPNIIASSLVIGSIGIFKIPLDIMTITIAAITIGIAVDNTIHYLYRYKEQLSQNMSNNESIKHSHSNVGYAVLTTSLTIAIGFSVLIASNFIPTILFGIFTSLAMIVAMLGVLITLPSLLSKFYR